MYILANSLGLIVVIMILCFIIKTALFNGSLVDGGDCEVKPMSPRLNEIKNARILRAQAKAHKERIARNRASAGLRVKTTKQ